LSRDIEAQQVDPVHDDREISPDMKDREKLSKNKNPNKLKLFMMLTMEIREKEGQLIVSRRDEKKTKKIIKLKKLEKNY
jgi:hypothetical protein